MTRVSLSKEEIRSRIDALGPWFHNLDLSWCADGTVAFSRRLSGGEMAQFRGDRAQVSEREDRPRYRMQRGILRNGNEATGGRSCPWAFITAAARWIMEAKL